MRSRKEIMSVRGSGHAICLETARAITKSVVRDIRTTDLRTGDPAADPQSPDVSTAGTKSNDFIKTSCWGSFCYGII